jgi:hypothetical protein
MCACMHACCALLWSWLPCCAVLCCAGLRQARCAQNVQERTKNTKTLKGCSLPTATAMLTVPCHHCNRRWARLRWCARQHAPWQEELPRMAPSTLGACVSCSDDKLDRLEYLVAQLAPQLRQQRRDDAAAAVAAAASAAAAAAAAAAQGDDSPAGKKKAAFRVPKAAAAKLAKQQQIQQQQGPLAEGGEGAGGVAAVEAEVGLGGMWSVLSQSATAFGRRHPAFEAWKEARAAHHHDQGGKAAAAAVASSSSGSGGSTVQSSSSGKEDKTAQQHLHHSSGSGGKAEAKRAK